MSDLSWLPRESGLKNHSLWGTEHFSDKPPGVIYEKKPILDPQGNPVKDLYSAWITLNNPAQYNSYTTEMVKGVIAGFENASADRIGRGRRFHRHRRLRPSARAATPRSTPNTTACRPDEYGQYMELFNDMVDSILSCKKPVICRVNGMRVAGGQEIGMACDITVCSRPGHLRPGRPAARVRPGRRRPRTSCPGILTIEDCHVELRFLRDVVRPTR
ncbi:MAG: enoyl-CoA hydratase-related protein [Desulfobacterales bacterium]|nr:enoyl-CoA hydratase-related protein [Desulfobacterales bacterium]